ncbi:MAG: glycosyltransferase family 1 protein [Beijerinckiaceae bacterium]|nr:glycosyltransferase family 1 protein [Beijerinckiaceae bacterium]
MRLLVATDAWRPQVNGVVRTIEETARAGADFGVETVLLTPERWRTVPLPSYSEIRLALALPGAAARAIEAERPDAVHIATEGPIGLMTRRWCLAKGMPFTTSYHTKFPEYLRARIPVPLALSYRALRRFHAPARTVMVATPTLRRELESRGFDNLGYWSRGVDTTLFHPARRVDLGLPGPIFLCVGRIAVEKNVVAFLELDLPGTKLVVGDGPDRAELQARYPAARFVGAKHGEELASVFASADVFVFPSLTDTYGLVQLEALAAGTPVAAFPVPGPIDVLGDCPAAVLSPDLRAAALAALEKPRHAARAFAERHTWHASAREFFGHVARSVGRPEPALNPAG